MRDRIKLTIFSLFFIACIIAYIAWGDFLSLATVKEHQEALTSFTGRHYALSVAIYISMLVSMAFFIPGALVMSLVDGFLFGTAAAVVYIDAGMTFGAVLAFLSARYVFGSKIQKRFPRQLRALNKEIEKHGPNYLAVLRIVPVMPFFAVNYLAAMTKMSCLRFAVATMLGILPGAAAYSFAGQRLSKIDSLDGLISPGTIAAFAVLAFMAIIPVILSHFRRNKEAWHLMPGRADRLDVLFRFPHAPQK